MVSVSSPLSPLFSHCETGRDGLYDSLWVATGGSSGVLALLNVAGVGDPHGGCSLKDEKTPWRKTDTHIDQAESYVEQGNRFTLVYHLVVMWYGDCVDVKSPSGFK
jgi:hypothetical protein